MVCTKSTAPDHPDLRVTILRGTPKARRTYKICGMDAGRSYLAYNNSIIGMERAIKERLLYAPLGDSFHIPSSHAPGYFSATMADFEKAFKKFSVFSHPLSHNAFAECYHGQKKSRYLKAAEVLARRGIRRSDAHVKFFMKYETYDVTTKKNPPPRGINPRSDEFLVSYGSYIRPLEQIIYKNLEKLFGHTVVFKGLNQADRGRKIAEYMDFFDEPVAVPADASKFESSVSKECLELTHRVYQCYFLGDRHFARLCSWTKVNIGSAKCADGFLNFKITGKRMSGDNDTALGNCLLSCAMAWTLMKKLDITKYRLCCDGDDVVFFMERRDYNKFQEYTKNYYMKLGYRMKVENPVYEIEHVDFCQSRPVFDGESYIMIRVPERALSKDSVSKKPLDNDKIFKSWIAAVGMGGISTTGGIPIHQSYYECYVRNSCGAKPLRDDPTQSNYTSYKSFGMKREKKPVPDSARFSYYIAFGITPDLQIDIENYYDNLVLEFGVDPQFLQDNTLLPWN
jgi:hypothetical protein